MKAPSLIALDFDGVLVDSSREVLRTALESWQVLSPSSLLPQDFGENPAHIQAFKELMPLGNRAEDFGVALAAIEAAEIPTNQEDYENFRRKLGQSFLQRFHTVFYESRTRAQQDDLEGWLSLHRPYRPFLDLLLRRSTDAILVLATSKDEASARLLLESWGAGGLFPTGRIYDKERGKKKSAHLEAILQDFRRRPDEIRFIDDKVNHLLTAAGIGVPGVLAGWGHNTRREHLLAREKRIPVADFKTVETLLFA